MHHRHRRPDDAVLTGRLKELASLRRRFGNGRLCFVSDDSAHGRRFRVLAVVDDLTAECLRLVADTSLSGLRVARELDAVIATRNAPAIIASDNGAELTSMAILRWSQERRVEGHYIASGKPQQVGETNCS